MSGIKRNDVPVTVAEAATLLQSAVSYCKEAGLTVSYATMTDPNKSPSRLLILAFSDLELVTNAVNGTAEIVACAVNGSDPVIEIAGNQEAENGE